MYATYLFFKNYCSNIISTKCSALEKRREKLDVKQHTELEELIILTFTRQFYPGLNTQESFNSSSVLRYVEQRICWHHIGFAGTSLDLFLALYLQTHATTVASNKRAAIKIANGMSQSASSTSWNLSKIKRKGILTRVVICKIFSTNDLEKQQVMQYFSLPLLSWNLCTGPDWWTMWPIPESSLWKYM